MSGPLTVPFAVAALFVPQTWLKALLAAMAILCAVVSSYKVWAAERSTVISQETRIEELEWPSDRPKIGFLEWGEVKVHNLPTDHHPAMLFQRGFHISNDGGVALEARVEDFLVGIIQARSRTISRIESHSRGFAPIWLEGGSPVLKFELMQQLKQAAEAEINTHRMSYGQEYRIRVRATYRDFNNVWYSSEADMIFHHHLGRIEFSSVTQRKLGFRPPSQPISA